MGRRGLVIPVLALLFAVGRDAQSAQRPATPDGPAYWRYWSDSTCGVYASTLRAKLAAIPDSVRSDVALPDILHFPAFGNYYHPEGPMGAGILVSGIRGIEGAVPAWPCGVFLPLYDAQRRVPQAWLFAGRLARRGVSGLMPLNRLPVITIGQSENALVAHEIRADGWFRVRVDWPGTHVGDGTWWAHISHIELGSVPLKLIAWEKYLLNRPSPLFVFRDRGRHRFHTQPDSGSAAVGFAPGDDYGLRALEVRGDWMRVHRQKDSGFCTDPRKPTPSDTGWIVWRTRERGSLLWVEAWDC